MSKRNLVGYQRAIANDVRLSFNVSNNTQISPGCAPDQEPKENQRTHGRPLLPAARQDCSNTVVSRLQASEEGA